MALFSLILINVIILIVSHNPIKAKDSTYFVGAPGGFCAKNGTFLEFPRNSTTVRILQNTELGLIYKLKVDFLRTGCRQNQQRCTLLAWKAVRNLAKFLENYDRDEEISIENSMLIPGFQYIVIVTIYNDTQKLEENRIILDYSEKLTNGDSQRIQLKLLGTEQSYNFIDFMITADYSICINVTRFSFKWELCDANGTLLESFPQMGSQLIIPSFTLHVDKHYQILCYLIDNNGEILAQTNQKFFIKSQGLLAEFPIKYLSISPHYPVRIRATIRNYDKGSNQEMQILWSCVDITNNKSCSFRNYQDEVEIEQGFKAAGRYRIDLKIRQDNLEANDYCIVNVVDSSPTIEIVEVDNFINPQLGMEISTTVRQLRSFCTLQWLSIVEENYDYLDLATVPGNPGKLTNITVKQDLFLMELQEFSNDTVDKEYDLIIPPPQGNWSGLEGDQIYLFRLSVICPALLEDYDDDSENEPLLYDSKKITVFADIIVRTNHPPTAEEFGISPQEGEAFVTVFTMSCSKIHNNHKPILYKFGYFYKNDEIIAATLLETNTIEVALPYAESGVQIFVEVCDVYGFCTKTSGPTVRTTVPKIDIYDQKMQELSNLIDNHENYRAFSLAFCLINFYKTTNDSGGKLEDFRSSLHMKITQQVEELLVFTDNSNDDNYRKISKDLIANINRFIYDLQIPENLAYKLIELHDNIYDVVIDNSRYIRRKILSYQDEDADLPTVDDLKTYLQTSESLIFNTEIVKKATEIKINLLEKLESYLTILCSRLYEKPEIIRIELRTLIVSLEKFDRTSLNGFHTIPFEQNSWKVWAKIELNPQFHQMHLCLGKMVLKHYFNNTTGETFMAGLFSTNFEKLNQSVGNVVILPFDSNKIGQPQCLVYQNQRSFACKTLRITSNRIQCACKYLGYFKVDTATFFPNSSKFVLDGNSTEESTNLSNFGIVSYIVIGTSVIVIILLILMLQCIFDDENDAYNEHTDKDYDSPKYTLLYDDELTDSHI